MSKLIKIVNLPTTKSQDDGYKAVQLTYCGEPHVLIGWPRHDQHHLILERFLMQNIDYPLIQLQMRRRPVIAPALEMDGVYRVTGMGKLLFEPESLFYKGLAEQLNFYNLKLDKKITKLFDEQMLKMGYTKIDDLKCV